jgi:Ca2+-binding EF-hand superfamily protein
MMIGLFIYDQVLFNLLNDVTCHWHYPRRIFRGHAHTQSLSFFEISHSTYAKLNKNPSHLFFLQYDHAHFERGGKIDFYNFIELMKPRIIEKNEKYNEVSIDQLFKEFDDDGDGYISAKELRQSLQKLGDNFAAVAEELTVEDVEEIMLESDLDGDGRISYSEFTIMIPRLNQIIEE